MPVNKLNQWVNNYTKTHLLSVSSDFDVTHIAAIIIDILLLVSSFVRVIRQSLRSADYIIKDRRLLEQLLDMEFDLPLDNQGIFYRGYSRRPTIILLLLACNVRIVIVYFK